jgi:hypothetical protein
MVLLSSGRDGTESLHFSPDSAEKYARIEVCGVFAGSGPAPPVYELS